MQLNHPAHRSRTKRSVFHVDTFLMTSAADLFVCCVLVEIQSLTSYPRGDYVIAKSNELINSSEAF